MTLELDIGPVAYEQMDADWLPGLCPYAYQWQVYQLTQQALAQGETLCLFLVTPTGSGKTLASYAVGIKSGWPALGVYPTNELIRDQERALQPWIDPQGDYRLLRVDSAQLDHWQAVLNLNRHSETLETLMHWQPTLITNPDILFYIFFGLYADYPASVRQRLFTLVGDIYRLFLFDEFHLYNVKQVADVAFLIGALQRINPARGRVFIFASATPESPVVDWLRDRLGLRVEVIEAEPSGAADARIIAYPLRLTLVPADLTRWQGPQALAENLPIIDDFLASHPLARLVTILDAVAGAINIAQVFRDRYCGRSVGEVHGLSSEEERAAALRRLITVGTSTIEVGIDFQEEMEKDMLIFEARTSSQFVQRFGRIARHEKSLPIPNRILALVPEYVYYFLAEQVSEPKLTRDGLYRLIRAAYQEPQDFHRYLTTHAPAEFHAAKWFIQGLFQPDDRPRIQAGLEGVIQALTDRTGRQAAGLCRRYREEGVLTPLMTFRGAGFEAGVVDGRGTDPGFPIKRYNLMFLLRRGIIKELDEASYLARLERLAEMHPEWVEEITREKRYAKRIGHGPNELLGVYGYFLLSGLLEKGRKIWFEVNQREVRGRKGQVTVLEGLEIVTEPDLPLRRLKRFLRRKRIVAWFMDVHPAAIKFGRALPPLFAVYELRVRQPGGAISDQVWSIAFNQDAFFLDSLGWYRQQREDEAIIL